MPGWVRVLPILETPQGGDNILSGLGLFTGRVNPRATALLWRPGEHSLVDDVKIMGGGGTPTADGKPLGTLYGEAAAIRSPTSGGTRNIRASGSPMAAAAPSPMCGAPTPSRRRASTSPTPARRAMSTRCRSSIMSATRFVLDNVQNWEFLAPQTEQEVGEDPDAVSLEIRNSRNILFANYHGYRVTRTCSARSAVKLFNSTDIRFRNVHVNAESGFASCDDNGCGTFLRASKFPFENAIEDMIALWRSASASSRRSTSAPADRAIAAPAPRAARSQTGGWFLVDLRRRGRCPGRALFHRPRFQRIYRWTAGKGLEVVRDHALDPVNLAVDASGNLLVLSSFGPKVRSIRFDPAGPPTN